MTLNAAVVAALVVGAVVSLVFSWALDRFGEVFG